MKSISIIASVFILTVCLVTLSGCKDEPPGPTEQELATAMLTTGGAWNLQSVTVDGVDRTSVYQNLKVTFSSSGFTVTSGGAVWPATGTWDFVGDSATTIERSDGLTLTVNELTDSRLVIAFNWTKTTYGPGRVQSMSGQHVFTFTK